MTGRVLFVTGLCAAAAVLAVTLHREHQLVRWAAVERARLCASALTPGRAGELSTSFDELHARYPELIAVAPLSPQGHVQRVLSADPLAAAAIESLTPNRTAPIRTELAVAGTRATIWAVTLPLNGAKDGGTWYAMFVLRDGATAGRASILLACLSILALPILVGRLLLTSWFDRHVVHVLSRFADTSTGRRREESRTPERWSEAQAVADRIVQESRRAQACDETVHQNTYQLKKQLQEKQARLDHQLRRAEDRATVDCLTKLRNRRFLDQELEPLMARQRARGGDLAVAMIDLDNFKALNDTHGHKIGDELLRIVGELLRATIRPGDIAVRVGGDEFLLLFPDLDGTKAVAVTERIRRFFDQSTSKSRAFQGVTMSIGVAAARECPSGDGHALIDRADKALYRAKRGGKARVCTSVDPRRCRLAAAP